MRQRRGAKKEAKPGFVVSRPCKCGTPGRAAHRGGKAPPLTTKGAAPAKREKVQKVGGAPCTSNFMRQGRRTGGANAKGRRQSQEGAREDFGWFCVCGRGFWGWLLEGERDAKLLDGGGVEAASCRGQTNLPQQTHSLCWIDITKTALAAAAATAPRCPAR